MKRIIIIIALSITCVSSVQAQVKLGLQFSPVLSMNRVEGETNATTGISSNGSGVRALTGLVVDQALTPKYFFSTGAFYVVKRVGLQNVGNQLYRLQYVQVPVTLKLFTNEVTTDLKIYTQVGLYGEVKIKESFEGPDEPEAIEGFKFFDTGLVAGGGVEYRIGYDTLIFAGVTYRRGFINITSELGPSIGELTVYNDLVSFDVGIKF
jgi:hypothetical protein